MPKEDTKVQEDTAAAEAEASQEVEQEVKEEAAEDAAAAEEEFDFGTFVADEDDADDSDEDDVKAAASEEKEKEPAEPEPAPQQAPEEEKQEQTQEPQTQATPEAEPAETLDTSQLQEQFKDFFSRSVDTLAEQVYVVDDATKEALDTEPSKVLPKLAAQVHMQVLTSAAELMQKMLPVYVPVMNERASQETAAEQKFFSEFPDLQENREEVSRIAAAYRQVNPKVSQEQAINEIGTIARVRLRKPIPQQQAAPDPARPPVPTSAVGGAASKPAPAQKTIWEELINEDD